MGVGGGVEGFFRGKRRREKESEKPNEKGKESNRRGLAMAEIPEPQELEEGKEDGILA